MRTTRPRIKPIEYHNATDEVRAMLDSIRWNGVVPNLHRTIANYPPAFTAFKAWGNHILRGGNSLSDRQREIVVLRVGWLCRAGYEWVAHVEIGKDAGLTEAEIEQLKSGSTHADWDPLDRALVSAAEEIYHDQFIADETWQFLASNLNQNQCMDVVFTIAQYMLVCIVLNSFGVQFDGDSELPEDVRRSWNL